MQEIKIVIYEEAYKKQVINLIINIQTKEYAVAITQKDQSDLEDISSYYCRGSGNFWIALAGEQVIGTIALIDIGNHQGAIRKMFVAQEYRGKNKGIAQQLLNTVFNWCREKNINEIFLGTVSVLKAAQRFYEKNGFEKITQKQLPKSFPVMSVDTEFYVYHMRPIQKVIVNDKFKLFNEYWSPKIVGDLNDTHIKVAKFKDEFVWHKHDHEDELFFVVKGKLLLKLRDQDIHLNEGEFVIIPKGVEHMPVAEDEAHVMLIEPKTTINTGNIEDNLTKKNLARI